VDSRPDAPGVSKLLTHLLTQGWLCRSVGWEEGLLATAVPLTANDGFLAGEVTPDQWYVLSRFAYLHTVAGRMVLESPCSPAQIVLHHPLAAAFVAALAQPHCGAEWATRSSGLPAKAVKLLLDLLWQAGMLAECREDGLTPEEEDPTLAPWEFHDLLFHSRSRRGRQAHPGGNTLRFQGRIEPLPLLKPPMSAESVDLYRPNLDDLLVSDVPFTRVLEERRSIRVYGDKPLTVQQLGEFLYRSARIRGIIQTELGELSSRPYPNGGAMYELEIYVAVHLCAGLPAGLYHYQPAAHRLYRLPAPAGQVEQLLKDAAVRSMAQQNLPHVLLIMAARFQRVSWKYESLAYALILKNVGVLQQTMNLVATAMGLAACALGNGDSDLFARAAGTNYYAETSVGELALGSMAGEGKNP
jgi:SagB-type dehydrogenase family enzyme